MPYDKENFFVGEINGFRSSIWKIIIDKNDVYLESDAFGSSYKISFHKSGDCQASYTSEYWADKNLPNKQRHIGTWMVSPQGNKAEIAFTILFPFSELIKHEYIDVKTFKTETLPIESPNEDECIKVVIYKTGTIDIDSLVFSLKPIIDNHVFFFNIENQQAYVITKHKHKISENLKILILEQKDVIRKFKKENNIPKEQVITSNIFLKENGVGQFIQIYE